MRSLREIAKSVPLLPPLYRLVRTGVSRQRRPRDTEEIFTHIYALNKWNGSESISGTGSDSIQTRVIVNELPALVDGLGIATVLDIPCGDFFWMKKVAWKGVEYTGADIVADLIFKNRARYANDHTRFEKLNLISDKLPNADLIICRDCLVHFSYDDVFSAMKNVCQTSSTYLLTTTFPERRENREIKTGQFRPLNLEAAPFNFPPPLKLINEGCTEGGGSFVDKALGLWKIDDLRAHLSGMSPN